MGKKVLFVDDDEGILKMAKVELQESGFEFHGTTQSEQAMKILDQEEDFDIVIIDIGLPDQNGLQLLQRIKERKKLLPTVIVSGDVSRQEEALNSGATIFIEKPFPLTFGDTINKVLSDTKDNTR